MASLEELQQAMLRNKQATSRLTGLDEQYGRAAALRDRPAPQIDQYGYVSPLAVMADVVGRSRGRREMRELAPQREQARADIAAGEGALEGYALSETMKKAQRDQLKFESDEAQRKRENELKDKEEARRERESKRFKGKAENWTDGKDKRAVVYNEQNKPVFSDTGEPVGPGWYVDETGSSSQMGTRGKAMTVTQKNALVNRAERVSEINRIADDFRARFGQIKGVPTRFANEFAQATSREDLMKYVSEDLDAETKAAAQWWADFKFNMLERRHELFGATLTANEQKAWDEALMISPGMDPREINKRIERLVQSENDRLIREADVGMTDPLESNRAAYIRAMEGVLVFNPETQRWERPGSVSAEEQAAAAEQAAADWSPPPGLVDTWNSLDEGTQARIRAIPDPNSRAAALQEIKALGEPAPPTQSALPQTMQGGRGRGRVQ